MIPLFFFLFGIAMFLIRLIINVLMVSNGTTNFKVSPIVNILFSIMNLLPFLSWILVFPSVIVVLIIKIAKPSNEIDIDYSNGEQSNYVNISLEDQLLLSYVGNNYSRIKNEKFNFGAFFFSVFYLLYRKVYIVAIIGLVLIYISNLLPKIVGEIVMLAIAILMGVFFNKYYVLYCKSQIKKLQLSNANLSKEGLNNLCRKKGGTSILWAIIIYIIWSMLVNFADSIANNSISTAGHLGNVGNGYLLEYKLSSRFEFGKEYKKQFVNLLKFTDVD